MSDDRIVKEKGMGLAREEELGAWDDEVEEVVGGKKEKGKRGKYKKREPKD